MYSPCTEYGRPSRVAPFSLVSGHRRRAPREPRRLAQTRERPLLHPARHFHSTDGRLIVLHLLGGVEHFSQKLSLARTAHLVSAVGVAWTPAASCSHSYTRQMGHTKPYCCWYVEGTEPGGVEPLVSRSSSN